MKKSALLTVLVTLALASASFAGESEPPASAPCSKSNQPAPADASLKSVQDKNNERKQARARQLGEKLANIEFLNSPQGIAFKNQLDSLDQQINAVYERYLNLFREDPTTDKGKALRAERDGQLNPLKEKREKTEADYEKLKENNPAYQSILERHLQGQLRQAKGKSKPAQGDADNEEEGDGKQ